MGKPRPVPIPAAVRSDLTSDRRGSPTHRPSNRAHRIPPSQTKQDLLALHHCQPTRPRRPPIRHPAQEPPIAHHQPDHRRATAHLPRDRNQRQPLSPQPQHQLLLLPSQSTSHTTPPEINHQSQDRCAHPLKPPPPNGAVVFARILIRPEPGPPRRPRRGHGLVSRPVGTRRER